MKMIKTLVLSLLAVSVAKCGMPSHTFRSFCNCKRAKDCVPWLLRSHSKEIFEPQMRFADCGFTELSEPMICCPMRMDGSFDFIPHQSNPMRDHSDRWIWERRMQTAQTNDDEMKFEKKKENRFINKNLIDDYVDWKTHRNCPPILFKDIHNSYHKHNRGHQFPPKAGHRRGHQHRNHHHHHHHHHPHDCEDISYGRKNPNFPEIQGPPSSSENPVMVPTTKPTMTPLVLTVNALSCGVTLNKRIIGGNEALPGEFPWIVRIAYLNRTDDTIAYRCSGSFISELHVLTAAHCVTNLDANLNLSHISIANSTVDVDCDVQERSCREQLNFFDIAETHVHPNYDNPKRANDIAILKIIRPPNTEVNYGTICLPSGNFKMDNLAGQTGIVAGWPNNEDGLEEINNARVRYVRLGIINNTDCAETYNAFREGFVEKITIVPSMICTRGQTNESDICRGDSGGPLMNDGQSNGDERYTLLGIVAFGPLCGLTNLLPAVYMRISEHMEWIVGVVM